MLRLDSARTTATLTDPAFVDPAGMGEPHVPVFADALPLLDAALGELGDGELVKVDDMQLVQIMSAIEVNFVLRSGLQRCD